MPEQSRQPRRNASDIVAPYLTATKVLVGINVVVFFLMLITAREITDSVMEKWGALVLPEMSVTHAWYRLVTAMFLHFDLPHLLNNMLLLLLLGETLERKLGPVRIVMVYLLGGLIGNVASYVYYISEGYDVISAGASGAVFAFVGGMVVVTLRAHGRYEYVSFKRLGIMILLSLYMGFVSSGVNNVAHVAGLLGGALVTFILDGKYDILPAGKR